MDRRYHQDIVDHANAFGFTPDPQSVGYRAFFFPTRYDYETKFDWVDSG